jgi:xanthine dehydrogenase accessory factor
MSSFLEAALACEQEGAPFAVVTLLSSRGHAPQDPGAKAIVTSLGLRWGTVGGGKIEARCIAHARECLGGDARDPQVFTWNLQRDIGMSCGGEVTVLFEFHGLSPWRIVVFGAGHVAQALTRGLALLDCRVTCIDHREEWLSRLPEGVTRVCMAEPARWLERARGDEYFMTMTQGHAMDLPILTALLRTFPGAPYLGAIGSDVKALKLRHELKAAGIPDEVVGRLRCPIGLPIGGNHPGEIAISVLAELLQVRRKQTPDHPGESP